MDPKSISASAALCFEGCEARYKAEYIDRIPDLQGDAGAKGSCVHACLQMWVELGQHLVEWPTVMDKEKAMQVVFEANYYDFFEDKEHYEECWGLCRKWVQRTDLLYGRTVISTEVKETFPLPTSRGDLNVTYIWDRCDQIAGKDKEVEIVDYKTVAMPVQPAELKQRIQPRVYSLAARMKWKDLVAVWVVYDLLRYDQVGVRFVREDDVETYRYLQKLAERIYASDGTQETLNPECRWCVRKHVCETLTKHQAGGGIVGMELNALVDHRSKLKLAADALYAATKEADEQILKEAEAQQLIEWDTGDTHVKVKISSRRSADSERVARIVGEDIMTRYGKIGVTAIDEILKNEELTKTQREQLRGLIRKTAGAPSVETKPKTPFSEDQ